MTTQERDEKLKAICTDEFLAKLAEVVKLSGYRYTTDYIEVANFVDIVYEFMGKPLTDMESYEIEY